MSEKDCRNDCTVPLRFPRRPGTHIFVGSGEDCFCCQDDNKISADNRPALPHFNYRLGTYGSIREFLLHGINNAPELRGWTHRKADDPAIALLEGAAILGDILTFYQETYANEAFLRTAQWRESISDLVRLLGYRLSPALGGNATFAFEIKKDEAVTIPAGFPVKATLEEVEQPAEFETTEEITAFPWLSRFNLFRPLLPASITNSTDEFYISSPNQFLSPIEIKAGDRLMIGESDEDDTTRPNRLTGAEIVIVDSIRELHGTKIFKIKGKLKRGGSISKLAAYKLGRAFHHFGYNSPREFIEPQENVKSPIKIFPVPNTRKIDGTATDPVISTNFKEEDFPIDAEIQDLPNNIPIIIQGIFSKPATTTGGTKDTSKVEANSLLQDLLDKFENGGKESKTDAKVSSKNSYIEYEAAEKESKASASKSKTGKAASVTGRRRKVPAVAMTLVRTAADIFTNFYQWGQMTGAVSVLRFDESLAVSTGGRTRLNIRNALFHETVSPLLVIKAAKTETTTENGNTLNFYGTFSQVQDLRNRRIMFEKTGEEAKILTVTQVPANGLEPPDAAQLYQITVSENMVYDDFPNEKPLVTVYGNLADADEGKLQPEAVLGDGDNTTIFQTFKLPKTPLTYHLNTANTPPETPELEIYVGGRLWQRTENFFERGADEEIYIVREDDDENSWVQFGDGKTGARLPTGVKNVSAIYRTGAGAFGALKADTKVQASAKLKNLDKIQMPQIATGGTEAESGENARQAAPGKVQSLGRLVSLRDFETETAAMPGVALASAAWSLVNNIPTVVITVLMETGRGGEITSIEETLNGYNVSRGAARFPIVIPLDQNGRSGKRQYIYVAAEYALDAKFRADLVEPEIRRVLGVNFGKATNKEDQTGLFSLRNRRFGKREYASTIEGKIQSVAGVIWARVTALWDLGTSDKPDEIALITKDSGEIVECSSDCVLSLYDEHLFLTQA